MCVHHPRTVLTNAPMWPFLEVFLPIMLALTLLYSENFKSSRKKCHQITKNISMASWKLGNHLFFLKKGVGSEDNMEEGSKKSSQLP